MADIIVVAQQIYVEIRLEEGLGQRAAWQHLIFVAIQQINAFVGIQGFCVLKEKIRFEKIVVIEIANEIA